MLSARLSAIDRFQRTRSFKIVASVLVILGLLTYAGFTIVGYTTSTGIEPEMGIPEMLQDQNGNVIPNPIAEREAAPLDSRCLQVPG
mgnify:CR=1 FL=1